MRKKIVVTAALSGNTTKEQNPAVPYTPEEFGREAKRVEEAGAAMVHIHFRDPVSSLPTTDPAIMKETVDAIRQNSNLLINLSTGVVLGATVEERKRPVIYHSPDAASLNAGTLNSCVVNYRDGSILTDSTYVNTLHTILEIGEIMHKKGIKPELECFNIAHVHNTLFFTEHYSFLTPPLLYSLVFGVMGGVRFNSDILNSYLHAIPPGSNWQGIGVGPFCFPVAMAGAIFGGNIRVGLEDNIYIDQRTNTQSKGSWDQVEKAVQIARIAGQDVASPEEARQILALCPKRPV